MSQRESQREIHRLGVVAMAQAYQHQRLTPVQVCEHLLARIDDAAVNCNAFAIVDHEGARAAARNSAERWLDGRPVGPLDGIPVAIKDVLDVMGMPTRYGSAACAEVEPAQRDCLLAQRLRAAGAILLGKTRTWEFAWRSNVNRDLAEVVTNPHDSSRSPGGSSSGSAAAVAAGLCPLAFGTDSGGSVRGPAGFCGIVGLKPSYAMIPVYPPSPMGDLEHIGIFAGSVADVGTALDQVGGSHPDDPASWSARVPLPLETDAMESLGFGFSVDLNYADPVAELRRHFSTVIGRLERAGFDMRALGIAFSPDFEQCYELFNPAAALTLELAPRDRRHLVDEHIRLLAQQAQRMSALDLTRAGLARLRTQRVFARVFSEIDCLLTLTQQIPANRLDETPPIMKQTRCFNMTGQPAISIPCGVTDSGLPIGLQLVCDRGRDGLLLTIAERVAAELA